MESGPDPSCRGNFGETLEDLRHVHVATPERSYIESHTGVTFLPTEHAYGTGPFCNLSTYRACGKKHRTGQEAFAAFEEIAYPC